MKKIVNAMRYILFAASFLVVISACNSNARTQQAPDFTLLNLNGDEVRLSDYKGKVVLLNFFATYCPPCRMEMADFVRLQNKFADKGFTVIAISVDENGPFVLPGFIQRLGLNFPVLMATSKVIADYGNIYALPQSFLIGRDQKIIKHYTGMITEAIIEPLIKEALGPEAAHETENKGGKGEHPTE